MMKEVIIINWIPVTSSNLSAISYDNNLQILYIKFRSGTYKYYNVPIQIFNGLLNAQSHGKYHARFIKKNYRYEQIG